MQFSKKTTVITLTSVVLIAVVFLFGHQALAQSLDLPSEFAGLPNADLKQSIENIVRIALGFLGILSIIFILYGGFVWMTSGGNADRISQAKKIIVSSVIGLILILTSYVISSFIITSLITTFNPGGGPAGGPPGPGPIGIGSGIIESHYPGRNATGIPRNTKILVTFKEPIDEDTMINDNIKVENLTNPGTTHSIAPVTTVDNLTFVITPIPLLGSPSGDEKYQVSLGNGILTKSATPKVALPFGYTWKFTVSSFSDITPPEVVSVIPKPGATVDRNTVVQINFSEAIDPTQVTGDVAFVESQNAIKLVGTVPGTVSGNFSVSNQYKTVTFISDKPCGATVTNSCGEDVFCLDGPDTYTGDVLSGVVDLAANSAVPYQWQFFTTDTFDLVPPVISSQSPRLGELGVGVDTPVVVSFSKPLNAATVKSNNFKINDVGYWLDLDTATGQIVTISHSDFDPQTNYTPAVKSGVRDTYQNCYNPCSCQDPTGASCGCNVPAPGCTGASCTSLEP